MLNECTCVRSGVACVIVATLERDVTLTAVLPLPRPVSAAPPGGQAAETMLEYPGWSLALLSTLILLASLPIPLGYAHALLTGPRGQRRAEGERYAKCSGSDPDPAPGLAPAGEDEDDGSAPSFLVPVGVERYRLLPQREEAEDEEDTGV